MKKRKRKNRKELLDNNDTFVYAAGHTLGWLSRYKRSLLIVAVLVVLCMGAGIVMHFHHQDQKTTNATAFAEAVALLNKKLESAAPTAEKDNQSLPDQQLTQQWIDARKKLQRVADQGGAIADVAQLYVADLSSKLQENKIAEKQYQQLIQRLSPKSDLYFMAVMGKAYTQEAQQNASGAIATLELLADHPELFYANQALFQKARLQRLEADIPAARASLEALQRRLLGQTQLKDPRKSANVQLEQRVQRQLLSLPVGSASPKEVVR